MRDDLTEAVAELVAEAASRFSDDRVLAARVAEYARRLEEPLRVAVIGMPKLGKSTLINAIIGEPVAETDAVRSTDVITWYRYGAHRTVTAHPLSGPPQPIPSTRVKGMLHFELPLPAEEIRHVVVEVPATVLRNITLIDTPGIGSLSQATATRSSQFLHQADALSDADAVIYLMRHLHQTDLQLLNGLREDESGTFASYNTLGVISGADLLGGGKIDSLISARKIAERYRRDSSLRPLLGEIHFIAGLLALGARNIKAAEFDALVELAELDRTARERMLVSADRFVRASADISSESSVRADLLERFGIFGIRMASALIRGGIDNALHLGRDLARQSGLNSVVELIHDRLQSRTPELRARAVLAGLEAMLRDNPGPESDELAVSLERVRGGAHEYRELRLLTALRGVDVGLSPELAEEAERLIGGVGVTATQRLGLEKGSRPSSVRSAALAAVKRWRELAEDPELSPGAVEACYVVVRSCEGIVAGLATGRSGKRSVLRLRSQPEPPVGGGQKTQNERRAG